MMKLMERQIVKSTNATITEKDHISNLSEDIIHEILYRLTMKDVARTSCVSKAWQSFCVSLSYLNFDQQDFSHLPCDRFKNIIAHKVRSMSNREAASVMLKFKLCMKLEYVQHAMKEIQRCVDLVTMRSVQEFDFQIKNHGSYLSYGHTRKLLHDIYNAETITVLRLSGLILEPCGDIKLSHLQNLSLENVKVEEKENVIGQFFTSCPLIMELRLVECDGLEHLKVSGLGHLKRLEIGFCKWLKSVEIQAPGLQKLVLAEIKRARDDEFRLALSIHSQTCETLRELTMRNSSLQGITFSRMFSRCLNVKSLVLDRCINFYRINILNQKLRKLVVRSCFNLRMTDLQAPNLTSFSFCTYLPPEYWDDTTQLSSTLLYLLQYCEEISHRQECMLDFNQILSTKNIWISVWYDKFKDSLGQKMVIYPKEDRYHVVVLEDWSSMAELSLMTKISEAAIRTIITTMSFHDLADYVFGDNVKGLEKVLTISSTYESKLYEALVKKPKISCQHCSSVVIAKTEVNTFSCSTYWRSFSDESIWRDVNGFFYKALLEAGMTATLKATWLSVTPKFS